MGGLEFNYKDSEFSNEAKSKKYCKISTKTTSISQPLQYKYKIYFDSNYVEIKTFDKRKKLLVIKMS
jgi:hypothetical protein